jgi:hypothetical protein
MADYHLEGQRIDIPDEVRGWTRTILQYCMAAWGPSAAQGPKILASTGKRAAACPVEQWCIHYPRLRSLQKKPP